MKGLVIRIKCVNHESTSPNSLKVMVKVCFFKVGQSQRSRSKGQGSSYPIKGLLTRITYMKYERPIFYCSKVMAKVKVFSQVWKSTRSRSKGQDCWYPVKGLITNITYVKYKCPGVYCSKDMAKVKF